MWESYQKLIDETNNGFVSPRDYPSQSLEYTSTLFNSIKGNTIVECGTGLQGSLSGDSMLYWFNKTDASTIHCIDLNLKWINSVKGELGEHPRITYHHEDCFSVVPKIAQIDLIYMDFWVGDGLARESAYTELYRISNNPKMILIDDSDHTTPWKHTSIVPEAVNDGYKIIHIGRQTLLLRGDISEKHAKDIEQ